MKQARQQALLDIITQQSVETQDGLLTALRERGFQVTQATISRDMKELSLIKKLEDGVLRYCVSPSFSDSLGSLSQLFKETVRSVVPAQNIIVVKTMPGLAMAACTSMDMMEVVGVVGTLAGDDTFLLIMEDSDTAKRLTIELLAFLD